MNPLPQPGGVEEPITEQIEALIGDMHRLYREWGTANRRAADFENEFLTMLSVASACRDDDTSVHMKRMGYLAEALALRAGQSAEYGALLRRAAPLHDLGKIGIPDHILKKPGGLTPEERAVMNQHPAIGARILGLSTAPIFRMARDVALNHHEKYDGTGYARGLKGDEIPLCARIAAIVDFFDALTMDRCYRPALPDGQVLAMLAEQRGRSFDPFLVDAFLTHQDDLIAVRDHVNERHDDTRADSSAASLPPPRRDEIFLARNAY